MAVLSEFTQLAPSLGYEVELLDAQAVQHRSAAVRPDALRGGLWSASEACVDPRQAIAQLPHFLAREYGVELCFSTPVHALDLPNVYTPSTTWRVERAIVCSGVDFESLYPSVYKSSGLTRCKLQMMCTVPQPDAWQLVPGSRRPHTASLRKFKECASAPYAARISRENQRLTSGAFTSRLRKRIGRSLLRFTRIRLASRSL